MKSTHGQALIELVVSLSLICSLVALIIAGNLKLRQLIYEETENFIADACKNVLPYRPDENCRADMRLFLNLHEGS